jgi:rRNA maturation protein Nop10
MPAVTVTCPHCGADLHLDDLQDFEEEYAPDYGEGFPETVKESVYAGGCPECGEDMKIFITYRFESIEAYKH